MCKYECDRCGHLSLSHSLSLSVNVYAFVIDGRMTVAIAIATRVSAAAAARAALDRRRGRRSGHGGSGRGTVGVAGEIDGQDAVARQHGPHLLGLNPGGQRVLSRALLLHGAGGGTGIGDGRRRFGLLCGYFEHVVCGEDDLEVVGREALEVAGELGELALVVVDLAEAVGVV